MPIDKIKRSLVWMRKTLGIIEKTTLPGDIVGEVRPTIDTLGWDRLKDLQVVRINAAAPSNVVITAPSPAGVIRYVHMCSLSHTDTGVIHEVSLVKRQQPNTFNVGIPCDRQAIGFNQFSSMVKPTFLTEGQFVVGQTVDAPVVGVLILTLFFKDIDEGEYISAM